MARRRQRGATAREGVRSSAARLWHALWDRLARRGWIIAAVVVALLALGGTVVAAMSPRGSR